VWTEYKHYKVIRGLQMKKEVILFTAALLCGCLLAGCQKSKADQLNSDTVTLKGGQIKAESTNENNEEKEIETKSLKINSSSVSDAGITQAVISLDEKRIIPDQSFDVELNDWGDVKFISYSHKAGADFEDVSFCLMKDNKVIYSFPYYGENNKTDTYAGLFDSVESVGFRDVNNDNLKDIIVIINYITGAGPQGMVPRPRARIFLADKKEFLLAKDLIEDITEDIDEKDITIDNICKYLNNR
jgi:outer membrane murein-binding lipoprotein Lpp